VTETDRKFNELREWMRLQFKHLRRSIGQRFRRL
jgi:hypothetical protein